MAESDETGFDRALTVRRQVMGSDYVDRAIADHSPENQNFQKFVTEAAWGRWTDTRLGRRERSFVTMAITVSLNRMDEFELHVRGAVTNGITRDELEAFVEHVGAYAGMPAAISARKRITELLAS